MKYQLVYFGNPILRQKAKDVEAFDEELTELLLEMERILKEHDGIGLAAPQVGVSKRVFLTKIPVEGVDGTWDEGPIRTFINPKLTHPSQKTLEREEGCLSIPGIYLPIVRPLSITVTALDHKGTPFEVTYEGLEARCCMHENDHLNGVLTVDRTTKPKRKQVEPLLKDLRKKYNSQQKK